ncbi:MAG: M17 family peptidase N-terminal domain-containing protein [Acidimicrobiales bacterium]
MLAISSSRSVPKSATAVDRPIAANELDQLGADVKRVAELQGFEGKLGQTLVLAGVTDQPLDVLVGIGNRADMTVDTLRRAAAAFVRAVSGHRAVATTLVDEAGSIEVGVAIRAVVEGLGLASYDYTAQKSDPTPATLRKVSVVASGKGVKLAMDQGIATVAAVSLARDLVNEPGGSLVPTAFAAVAKKAATDAGLQVQVWDEKKIARERLGGLLGVNKGSTHPPRLVVITYTPSSKPTGKLAFVGKGVTFDTGGYSLKTGVGMMDMKIDMEARPPFSAMLLLPILQAPAAVTAYLPLTDNMIDGDATRPGDVLTARNGKTIEVLNTDAEGRLILADALSLAAETKPDAIIDIATLTGAVTAALGQDRRCHGGRRGRCRLRSSSGSHLRDDLAPATADRVPLDARLSYCRSTQYRHQPLRRSPDGGSVSAGVHRRFPLGPHRPRRHGVG